MYSFVSDPILSTFVRFSSYWCIYCNLFILIAVLYSFVCKDPIIHSPTDWHLGNFVLWGYHYFWLVVFWSTHGYTSVGFIPKSGIGGQRLYTCICSTLKGNAIFQKWLCWFLCSTYNSVLEFQLLHTSNLLFLSTFIASYFHTYSACQLLLKSCWDSDYVEQK